MNRITVFDCRSFKVHVLIINLISHQFEEKQSFKQSCWKYFQFKLYNLFISALIFLKIQSNVQFLYIKQTQKKTQSCRKDEADEISECKYVWQSWCQFIAYTAPCTRIISHEVRTHFPETCEEPGCLLSPSFCSKKPPFPRIAYVLYPVIYVAWFPTYFFLAHILPRSSPPCFQKCARLTLRSTFFLFFFFFFLRCFLLLNDYHWILPCRCCVRVKPDEKFKPAT